MSGKKIPVFLAVLGAAIMVTIIVVAVIDNIQHGASTRVPVDTTAVITDKSAPPPGVRVGNRIGNMGPDFTLNTVGGKELKLSDYRGKPVLLNFWATWCGPCKYELPYLKAAEKELSNEGISIIAVSTQDTPDGTASYVKEKDIRFAVPLDPTGKVAGMYNVRGIPSTFFIDEDGIITSIKIGPFISVEDIESHLASFK